MVSFGPVLCLMIELLTVLIVPIVAALIYCIANSRKGVWKAYFWGVAGFLLFHVIIRVPIMGMVTNSIGFGIFEDRHYNLACILLAITMALFETVLCFIVVKILQKKINYQQGIAAGLGYGTINAIALVGVPAFVKLVSAIFISSNLWNSLMLELSMLSYNIFNDSMLIYGLTDDVYYVVRKTPAYVYLLESYGCILSMTLYIALSVLICYFAYKKKSLFGVAIAFITYFLVALIKGMSIPFMSIYMHQWVAYALIYGLLTLIALVAVVLAVIICKKWKKNVKRTVENEKTENVAV